MTQADSEQLQDWIRVICKDPKSASAEYAETDLVTILRPWLTQIVATRIPANLCVILEAEGIAIESIDDALRRMLIDCRVHEWTIDEFKSLCVRIGNDNRIHEIEFEKTVKRGGTSVKISVDEFGDSIADRSLYSDPTRELELGEQRGLFLAGLPDDLYRQIWILKWDGNTTNEISEATGLDQKAINRRLRATKALYIRCFA